MCLLLYLVSLVASAAANSADPASCQLFKFKQKTCGPIGIMTSGNGAPVEYEDTNALNSPLMSNIFFLEQISHLVRERIPERVVHAKGTGAYGYFKVTHNISHLCKASLFSRVGKKTPVVVRFSQTGSDKGELDTSLDVRGFSVKFYTPDGNWDFVGFQTPMFLFKDPNMFFPLVKILKRNAATGLRDRSMMWDLVTLRPESAFAIMYLFADFGIPDGYRHLPGFSIHTYQVYNKCGESSYCRFHILPYLGIKNIIGENVAKISLADADYAIRDLYNAIAKGYYPRWTVYTQCLSYDDVLEADFDVFDLTKILPEDKYPLMPVGDLVLNRNPKNVFAEIEQLAFCPGNVVPGILGAPDSIFTSRRFSYRDSQLYRLGANFNRIHVNCPRRSVFSYERDGVPPVVKNGEDGPNYYPNSYNGPEAYVEKNRPKMLTVTHDESLNFDQAADFYNELPKDQRSRMISNIVSTLGNCDVHLQQRVIELFNDIHPDIGLRIAAGLGRCNF